MTQKKSRQWTATGKQESVLKDFQLPTSWTSYFLFITPWSQVLLTYAKGSRNFSNRTGSGCRWLKTSNQTVKVNIGTALALHLEEANNTENYFSGLARRPDGGESPWMGTVKTINTDHSDDSLHLSIILPSKKPSHPCSILGFVTKFVGYKKDCSRLFSHSNHFLYL